MSQQMRSALAEVIGMVDNNTISVRPSDRDAFLEALERWNKALEESDPSRVAVEDVRHKAQKGHLESSILSRAWSHPVVLEIMAECAEIIEVESSAVIGPEYDGSGLRSTAKLLREQAFEIRSKDPDIWQDCPVSGLNPQSRARPDELTQKLFGVLQRRTPHSLQRHSFDELLEELGEMLDDKRDKSPEVENPTQSKQEPLFWYRPRSDGGYEGPLHNSSIDDVRKTSGSWIRLYPDLPPTHAVVQPTKCPYDFIYEFEHPVLGKHRSLSEHSWNGVSPARSIPVWTTPAYNCE